MKDYFKRNSPIFYIGIATAVVFLFIIFAGQNTPNTTPTLEVVNQEEIIAPHSQTLGFKDARVTAVEFIDYNCPACKAVATNLKNLESGNKNKFRIVIRHLPLLGLPGHETSYSAALAAQASAKFNKFSEMHYALLEAQSLDKESILGIAERIGINKEEFQKEWDSEEAKKAVDLDMEAAKKLQINGTPTIYLNGKRIDNSNLNTLILAEINKFYPQN